MVYYIDEPDGLRVVVTTRQRAVAQFETVLAAGQSAAVSVARTASGAPRQIVLSNAGDHLHINEPAAARSNR